MARDNISMFHSAGVAEKDGGTGKTLRKNLAGLLVEEGFKKGLFGHRYTSASSDISVGIMPDKRTGYLTNLRIYAPEDPEPKKEREIFDEAEKLRSLLAKRVVSEGGEIKRESYGDHWEQYSS